MRVHHTDQTKAQAMEMDGAVGVSLRLMVGREHGAPTFAMRHFTVEPDGHTPLHRHNYEHEVYVVAGKGLVRSGDTHREVTPGSAVFISANELHQFSNTGPDPLQFVCMVPVQFDCGNGQCQPTPGS